jgi:hypothetical protein
MLIGAVDFFPQHYGATIIPLALDLLEGRPVPPAVYTDHLLLTPQNVGQVYSGEAADEAGRLAPDHVMGEVSESLILRGED